MTARSWREGDPEPADHPAVVDPDGHTWAWEHDDVDGLGIGYHRQVFTHHSPQSHLVTTGPTAVAWTEIWERLPEGAELREATAEEAATWVEQWVRESA